MNDDQYTDATPDGMTIMPFGKYRGRPLHEVPRGYLRWMLSICRLSEDLKADVAAVVRGDPLPLSLAEQVNELMQQDYGR